MEKVMIIMPEKSGDCVSEGLRKITKALKSNGIEIASAFLGGEFGYGTDFENETFMIHHFCWCEEPDCKWCNGTEPNFRHKKTGFKVNWYKWIGRDMQSTKISCKKWKEIEEDCIKSLRNAG